MFGVRFSFKLVRDAIPAIIESKGGFCVTRTLKDKAFREALSVKLVEEAKEVRNATTRQELISELADLAEVAESIRTIHGITKQDIELQRKVKAAKAGLFTKGIKLIFAVGPQ